MISLATVSEKSTAFLMISVSKLSKTPPFRLSPTIIFISSSEWASSLSLAGLMPKILSETPARKSKVLISGEKTTQNTCSGRAMARTAFSDFAMATDFGTSSPSTTCMSVISVNAIANATVWTKISFRLKYVFSGSSISLATAGSPIQPRASELSVMPSCVAERYVSRLFDISSAVFAFGTLSLASSSRRVLRTLTMENSDKTKKAFRNTKKNARAIIKSESALLGCN